jgi:hypothetical protein
MSGYFSLEAVYAKKGDALILHYGARTKPRWILIDGGHDGVYDAYLRPRLEELRLRWPRRLDPEGRLPLEMVMVSHADADHIQGILDLFQEMAEGDDPGRPGPPVTVDNLWFNGFDDLLANSVEGAEVIERIARTASFDAPDDLPVPAQMRDNRDVRAVVASTRQGRRLRGLAQSLAIESNAEYGGDLVMRGGDRPSKTNRTSGLTLHLVGPDAGLIERYRRKWKSDLAKILADEGAAVDAASFKDQSAFNLSSIMLLVRRGSRSMLLTGDARGDHLIDGLEAEGLLRDDRIHVDLFKLPHHGSDRNAVTETFERITADHYVVSANGEHHNPEPATLDMLVEGRARTLDTPYSIHLTFPEEAFRLISDEEAERKKKVREQREALEAVDHWIKTRKPPGCTVVYRDRDQRSLAVDLGAERVF